MSSSLVLNHGDHVAGKKRFGRVIQRKAISGWCRRHKCIAINQAPSLHRVHRPERIIRSAPAISSLGRWKDDATENPQSLQFVSQPPRGRLQIVEAGGFHEKGHIEIRQQRILSAGRRAMPDEAMPNALVPAAVRLKPTGNCRADRVSWRDHMCSLPGLLSRSSNRLLIVSARFLGGMCR